MRNKLIDEIFDLRHKTNLDLSAVLELVLKSISMDDLYAIKETLQIYPRMETVEFQLGAVKTEVYDRHKKIFKIYTSKDKFHLLQVLTKVEAAQQYIEGKPDDIAVDQLLDIIQTDDIPQYNKVSEYYTRSIDG